MSHPLPSPTPVDASTAVASLNDQALMSILACYSIRIHPRNLPDWRPCQQRIGDIPGVAEGLTILCHNGNLGYFRTSSDEIWCCHTQYFTGKIRPLFSARKSGEVKPKDKKPRAKRDHQPKTVKVKTFVTVTELLIHLGL